MAAGSDSERAVELQKLLRRLRPRILEVLRSHRVPEREAAEIVHDTFIALAVRWNRVGNREAWLMGTLEARCRDLARRGGRRGGGGGPGGPTGLDG
jgi:DNA-directed RNA polymerase specialized sigma24 family protein